MPDDDQNPSQEQDSILAEHDTTIRNANLKASRFYRQYTLQ